MNTALEDELLSINAIYGPETLTSAGETPGVYIVKLPETGIAIRISFPTSYPNDAPSILGPEAISSEIRKGEANELVSLAQDVLLQIFNPGEPCIFDLIQEVGELFQYSNVAVEEQNEENNKFSEQPFRDQGASDDNAEAQLQEDDGLNYEPPDWALSEVVIEKKSTFLARAVQVKDVKLARKYLEHLVTTDKKVARATHNITAWRIRDNLSNAVFQDCDDDGEDAAGGRLLHLLQLMDIWDVMVVVSRWFGGVKLGSDRFRIINSVARDALSKGQFVPSEKRQQTSRKKGYK